MKMYVKNGVVKTPKDIEIVKSIRNEIEMEDFVPIEGELDENGDQKFKTVIKTVVQEKEVKVYNPTEEDILADGWEVYEPKCDLSLSDVIAGKVEEIVYYDQSDAVNVIIVDGEKTWIAKADRVGLAHLLDVDRRTGVEKETFWFGTKSYSVTIDEGFAILDAIEAYAKACYNVTQQHISAVSAFGTKEEVESFDITSDYPKPLTFNF